MEFSEISLKEFENFYNNFEKVSKQRTFMQTKEIAKLREKNGWTSYFLGAKKNKQLIAATLIVSIKRHFGKKEFYAPRGFLLDYSDYEVLDYFTNEVKKFVKNNNGYQFRIDPYIINVERNSNGDKVENGIDNTDIKKHLKKIGYKIIPKEQMEQVGWMYVLDIENKTEDEILKNMKPNTRNTIRKTLKNGIEIKELNKTELKDFYKIMEETGKRKNFSIRSLQYYEDMYDLFHEKKQIKYLITKLDLDKHIKTLEEEKKKCISDKEKLGEAKYNDGKRSNLDNQIASIDKKIKIASDIKQKEGSIINLSSSMFMLTQPEIIYLSSGNYEEYMFYNSQYLIQWEMIKYGIKHGFTRYNFYGITGNFDKNDKDYGIYEFKTGFNGYCEELIGEYVMPTSPIYYLINAIHKLKK